MTNNEKFLQHIQIHGKDRSWSELAELFSIKQGYSTKQKSDYVRKLARRSDVNEGSLFQEFLDWKKANKKTTLYSRRKQLPKVYTGNENTISVIKSGVTDFIPASCSDWKNLNVSLVPYLGKNIIIKFILRSTNTTSSFWGGNLYIDNICFG